MRDIIGHGGGKGGGEQHVHYEATDSLHSTSYARVLDLVSEGEILGLANGMESVFLDGTPVANADGSKNFKDITVDFRPGTQTQDFIPGFPDVENEIAIGVELRSDAPWTRAISNLSLSAVRIMLGVPSLSKSDTTNGDIGGYNIDYKIELSKDGGAFATVLTNSFNGKTTGQYRRSARIDLPPATTGWSVRVTRLTANANTASIADTTSIVSYTEVIDAKLRYPMSAIVGVQVDAKQFQSIPVRAYDMYGRIVQVPANYDPVTRVYTGVWDGTFKPAWTSCPPWIFRDMVLNDRYGLGARITAAQVDKWALYAIARYCDEMVPNGKGGTEPRFSCNVYLQSQKQAYAVLQDLASIFRGISYWGGGSVIASADMPSDPVYVYTAANVIGGKFSRVGSSKKTRYTVALVSWNDMTDMGRAKVEYVEDAEGIKRYGIQQVSMTAFGCSSQGQAQRVGRWALATSRFETGMISFDVGMDGAIALPGQIVRIADPARMGKRNGGRVRTAAGRVVTLDKAPVINAGDSLTVILPTGVSQTRTVSSVTGDAVTVSADWTTVPLAESVWSVDSSALSAPTFKTLSVKENKSAESITYTITATQHEPGKFAFVDSNTVIVPTVETSLDVSKQAAPASVSVSGNTVTLNDVQKLTLLVSCAEVVGAIAYEGAYKRDSGNWIPLVRQPGPTFDVPDIISGTYTAKLSAVNSIGVASLETVSTPTAIAKTIDSMYNAAARLNNALVYAYQRAASAPSGTPGAVDYDFVSKVITTATLANGWQKAIPTANGNPLYVTVATASSSGTTDNIASTEWSSAVILAQDGPGGTGTNGLNTATAYIYQRGATSTVPALPSVAATYNFGATSPLTGLNNGWSATVPSTGGAYLFVSTATASSVSGSDSIPAIEWAAVQLLAQDGAQGSSGTSVFVGKIYLQNATLPSTPTGGTFNFGTATLTPPSGWSATQPTSSTTPTWVAQYTFSTSTAGATVTAGTWSTPVSVAQNGANGSSGVQSGAAIVYQWAATIPSGPAGAATYTWSSGTFGSAPTGWALTPGTSPSPGFTLWAAKVGLTDSAANAATAFNWTGAAITAAGYAGSNGTNGTGTPGAEGASYVTAYCASSTGATTTAPAATTGRTSLPATNSGGLAGTYSATVPALTTGQYLYQTDGIYNPSTNQVIWSIPYWSSLKVGSLSAIVTNTGDLNVSGTIKSANDKFQVDSLGNVIMRSASIQDSTGAVILAAGVPLAAGYEAPGTKNSDQTLGALGYTGDANANFVPPSKGSAINEDPAIEKPSAWSMSGSTAISSGASGTGVAGDRYFRSQAWALNSKVESAKYAIDPNKTYSLTANVFQDGFNDRALFIFIQFFDGSGGYLGNAGWGGWTSGYAYVGVPPSGWSRQGSQFGVGVSGRSVPSNARTCTVGVWFNHDGSGSTTTAVQGAQDIRLEPVIGLSLIDPSFQSALTDKLSKSAASILSAPITVAVGGALQVGTAAWTGSAPTGTGVVTSAKGMAFVYGGVPKITMDTTTGDATFGGTLTASQVITTDNLGLNSAAAADIFSTGISAAIFDPSVFVVTRTAKVWVMAKFSADGSGFYISNMAGDTVYQQVGGNSGESGTIAFTLAAGTYKLLHFAGSTSFAYVLKVYG